MAKYFKHVLQLVKVLSPKPNNSKPRLVTIGFSHFSEKARWALDQSPLDYEEETHVPALHLSSTLMTLKDLPRIKLNDDLPDISDYTKTYLLKADKKIISRKDQSSVPKLVIPKQYLKNLNIDDNKELNVVSGGSSGILRFLASKYPEMTFLYPKGEIGKQVLELENYFDVELAMAATNWSFSNILLTGKSFNENKDFTGLSKEEVKKTNTESLNYFLNSVQASKSPFIERLLMSLFGKNLFIPLMIKGNNITAKNRGQALIDIHKIFSKMDGLLALEPISSDIAASYKKPENSSIKRKRMFLLGTSHLTAADITFAALSFPLLLPSQTSQLLSSKTDMEKFITNTKNENDCIGCRNMVNLADELLNKYESAKFALELYENNRFKK